VTGTVARWLIAWAAGRASASERRWIEALRGELELVERGPAQLLWALGGLSLLHCMRRRALTRSWYSLPSLLRSSSFGLALSAVLVVGIIWSNVIVPSHESDDEYTAWYVAFYIALPLYFAVAGAVASSARNRMASAVWAGALTAALFFVIVMVTFVVIDNVYLDVVMQQPDKALGFRSSGLTSARDYVNQGNSAAFFMLPVLTAFGAVMGMIGGLVRTRIDLRRGRPAMTS
jgi:hypothetical protein